MTSLGRQIAFVFLWACAEKAAADSIAVGSHAQLADISVHEQEKQLQRGLLRREQLLSQVEQDPAANGTAVTATTAAPIAVAATTVAPTGATAVTNATAVTVTTAPSGGAAASAAASTAAAAAATAATPVATPAATSAAAVAFDGNSSAGWDAAVAGTAPNNNGATAAQITGQQCQTVGTRILCPMLVAETKRCIPDAAGEENPIAMGTVAGTLAGCVQEAIKANMNPGDMFVLGKATNAQECEKEVVTGTKPLECVGRACCSAGYTLTDADWDTYKLIQPQA